MQNYWKLIIVIQMSLTENMTITNNLVYLLRINENVIKWLIWNFSFKLFLQFYVIQIVT